MDNYEKCLAIFDRLDDIYGIVKDLNLYIDNLKLLKNYNREKALYQLAENIKIYKAEITLMDGNIKIIYNTDYSKLDDIDIIIQLLYLTKNMPAYEALKQGKKELYKHILKTINGEQW